MYRERAVVFGTVIARNEAISHQLAGEVPKDKARSGGSKLVQYIYPLNEIASFLAMTY